MLLIILQFKDQTHNMNKDFRNQSKLLKIITDKLKEGQFLLTVEDIWFIPHKKLPVKQLLVITSSSLYFYEFNTLRKYIKVNSIHRIIMTPFSNELMICVKEGKQNQSQKQSMYRISSQANVRIIKNILEVQQKFGSFERPQNSKGTLSICLTKQKNLCDYSKKVQNSQKSRSRFMSYFFYGASANKITDRNLQNFDELNFNVTLKDFALSIGQKMYEQIYANISLLYINSDKSFLFLQDSYDCEDINEEVRIFTIKETESLRQIKSFSQGTDKNTKAQSCLSLPLLSITNFESQPKMMMRRIMKRDKKQDGEVASMLKNYRNREYKQQIRYSIQTETHFEVLIPLAGDQRSMSQILESEECSYFCEKDLRSVFIKLLEMIQDEPKKIFHSLSLQNIRSSKESGIKISEIFSTLPRNTELEYIAPEQLRLWNTEKQDQSSKLSSLQIQLINLWKTGILMFEAAYGNVPYPAQIILDCFLTKKQEIRLSFPEEIFRTFQFQKFIESLLKIDPKMRGGEGAPEKWKQKVMALDWVRLK